MDLPVRGILVGPCPGLITSPISCEDDLLPSLACTVMERFTQ